MNNGQWTVDSGQDWTGLEWMRCVLIVRGMIINYTWTLACIACPNSEIRPVVDIVMWARTLNS